MESMVAIICGCIGAIAIGIVLGAIISRIATYKYNKL